MEKAYDLKVLGEKLKAKGLLTAEVAVEAAGKEVYGVVKEWFKESAALSKTQLDDLVAPFIDKADETVHAGIEKLDLDGDGK